MPPSSTGWPAHDRNASVGPFSERPPTSGLTATTGASVSARASRIPGSASIGPMRRSGSRGRSPPPPPGRWLRSLPVLLAPPRRRGTPRPRAAALSVEDQVSWKWRHSPSVPRTLKPLMRTSRTSASTPCARASTCAISVRRTPSWSISVRNMQVARSRSPSLNHSAAPSSNKSVERLRRSRPRSRSLAPRRSRPRPVGDQIRSGDTWSPKAAMSSPVLATTARRSGPRHPASRAPASARRCHPTAGRSRRISSRPVMRMPDA